MGTTTFPRTWPLPFGPLDRACTTAVILATPLLVGLSLCNLWRVSGGIARASVGPGTLGQPVTGVAGMSCTTGGLRPGVCMVRSC